MSIDKIEQDSCGDCQEAEHCFVCDCCRYLDDDDEEHDRFHPSWIEGCVGCIDRACWIEANR